MEPAKWMSAADKSSATAANNGLKTQRGTATSMDRPLAAQSKWRQFIPYSVAGVFAIFIIAWIATRTSAYRLAPDRVTVGTVTRARFDDFIAIRAGAVPFTTRYLTAEQGGVVAEVFVEDGATVKAGQALLRLSNASLQLQVASREADTASQINALENTRLQLEETRFKYQHDLLEIEHQLGKLKGDVERDKVLLDGNAIAPATYHQEEEEYAYELKLKEATIASRDAEQTVHGNQLAQLRETLARLKESASAAKSTLEALNIRAPSDGRLTALNAQVGESKVQGAVLGQVDSLDRFKLTAQVDEYYLGRVQVGEAAQLSFENRQFTAKVVKIYPQITSGTFKIDLAFDGSTPQGVHTGQSIDTRLILGGSTDALTLPNGPFYQDTGGHWVFVVAADGRSAARRSVRLGRRNPDYVEVLEGLQPGERVVVSGYEAFKQIQNIKFDKPVRKN